MSKIPPRYIPSGANVVRAKNSSAVAYLYTSAGGSLCAIGYQGARGKADMNYRFPSIKTRFAGVAQFFAQVAEAEAYKAKRAAERKAALAQPCELAVGDVLSGCWGYDQTNVEWWEVIAQKGRKVEICKIASESVENGFMSGKSVPLPGVFLEREPKVCIVQPGGYVRVDCFSLSKAERLEVAGVSAGYKAKSWTAYA